MARNTLFNLTTEAAQRACLAEVVACWPPPGGWWSRPSCRPTRRGPTSSVEVRSISADRVLLFVDRHDSTAGESWSSFVDIRPDGVHFRPCHVRYLRPAQLDDLAAQVGLALEARHGDWSGTPFDEASAQHVSVYRRA